MKKLITCLTAGLLVVGAQSLLADDATTTTTPANPPAASTPGAHKDAGKERAALMKILGLTRDDLKDLSPKDRQAKVKETAQKFVADLKAKKASGSLTDEEQANLDKVEKFLAHSGHKKPAAPATPSATTPPAQ